MAIHTPGEPTSDSILQEIESARKRGLVAWVKKGSPRMAVPRIVCTKCPAVAKVHHWQEVSGGAFQVWAECHGEHLFGDYWPPASTRTVGDASRDIVLTDIKAYSDEMVHNHFTNAEQQMQTYAAKAALFKAYLDRRPPSK
jgi:hypothetical protein